MERFGWNHHVHVFSFAPPFLWHFGASSVFSCLCKNVMFADLGHAVVLLLGAVVPQALAVVPASGAVVPQVPTAVPLPWSSSTVASGKALLLLR